MKTYMRVCKYHLKTHSTLKSLPQKLRENFLTGSTSTAFQSGSIFSEMFSYDEAIKHQRAFNAESWEKGEKTFYTLRGSRSKSQEHRLYFS